MCILGITVGFKWGVGSSRVMVMLLLAAGLMGCEGGAVGRVGLVVTARGRSGRGKDRS